MGEVIVPDDIRALIHSDDTAKQLASMTDLPMSSFLPYLAIAAGTSKDVLDGKWSAGAILLHANGTVADLGRQASCLVVGVRMKAMFFKPKVLSNYDKESAMFQEIIAKQAASGRSNCGWGPEYLLWLPSQQTFAGLFLSSKSGRNCAAAYSLALKNMAPSNIVTRSVSNDEGTWFVCECKPGNAEIVWPAVPALQQALSTFNNPPAEEVELATAADKSAAGDRE